MTEPPEHRVCRSSTRQESIGSYYAERLRWIAEREWLTIDESTPVSMPGPCDRVCPEHNRACAQPHIDDGGHACVFCTTWRLW